MTSNVHLTRSLAIEMVTVGNPGNPMDASTGYGAVADIYQISTFAVTIQQYTTFLNAVAASDPYGLYNPGMASEPAMAGILRSGDPGSYTYSVIWPAGDPPSGADSPGDPPITFISWFDAARFANWMHNGQGTGSTEIGAYTLLGASTGQAVAANPGARFHLPTQDEWYKAAYYSPLSRDATGAYDAFPRSPSFYGTFDQTGTVSEWTDATGSGGGIAHLWNSPGASTRDNLTGDNLSVSPPHDEFIGSGFRLARPVASTPTPAGTRIPGSSDGFTGRHSSPLSSFSLRDQFSNLSSPAHDRLQQGQEMEALMHRSRKGSLDLGALAFAAIPTPPEHLTSFSDFAAQFAGFGLTTTPFTST